MYLVVTIGPDGVEIRDRISILSKTWEGAQALLGRLLKEQTAPGSVWPSAQWESFRANLDPEARKISLNKLRERVLAELIEVLGIVLTEHGKEEERPRPLPVKLHLV